MIVFLNGKFIPEEQAHVSVLDRGFLYGDGLFETLRVSQGRLFRWEQHWARLARGMEFLNVQPPFLASELLAFAEELLARNDFSEATLRVTISRGIGRPGYSPAGALEPTLVMTAHPAPALGAEQIAQWRLITSSLRLLSRQELAQFKTCNKLPQVLARAEAEAAGAHESLLLNSEGWVVEAAAGNLFWVQGNAVCTPPENSGILPGVTRAVILELCRELKLETRNTELTIGQLRETEGVFVSLSTLGLAEAVSLDEKPLRRSPMTSRIHQKLVEKIHQECNAD